MRMPDQAATAARARPFSPVRGAASVLVALALLAASAGPAPAGTPESAFHIDRNKNRNQVHYGVHVDAACRPEGAEPVYNYWLRREDDPVATRPLSYFQQAAYGFTKQNVEKDGRIEVRLRALPDRQLVIRVTPVDGQCKTETFLEIDGKTAFLEKVFVFADEGIVLPTVRYIELFGRSNDGVATYEKITVSE